MSRSCRTTRRAPKTGKPITVRFRFLASPIELLGDANGHVRAVKIENNAIVARDDGSLAARGTGTFEEIQAQLVFRSMGSAGQLVPDIPLDERRGVIRNEGRTGAATPMALIRSASTWPAGSSAARRE